MSLPFAFPKSPRVCFNCVESDSLPIFLLSVIFPKAVSTFQVMLWLSSKIPSHVGVRGRAVFVETIERVHVAVGDAAGGRREALLVGVEAAIANTARVKIAFDAIRIIPGLRG